MILVAFCSFFLNRFPVCFVILFLGTPCLVVAAQPCMEWIAIKKISPIPPPYCCIWQIGNPNISLLTKKRLKLSSINLNTGTVHLKEEQNVAFFVFKFTKRHGMLECLYQILINGVSRVPVLATTKIDNSYL